MGVGELRCSAVIRYWELAIVRYIALRRRGGVACCLILRSGPEGVGLWVTGCHGHRCGLLVAARRSQGTLILYPPLIVMGVAHPPEASAYLKRARGTRALMKDWFLVANVRTSPRPAFPRLPPLTSRHQEPRGGGWCPTCEPTKERSGRR